MKFHQLAVIGWLANVALYLGPVSGFVTPTRSSTSPLLSSTSPEFFLGRDGNNGDSSLRVATSPVETPLTDATTDTTPANNDNSNNNSNSNDGFAMPDMLLLKAAQQKLMEDYDGDSSIKNIDFAQATLTLLEKPSPLSPEDLENVFPVLVAWSKTSCPTGAITAERILKRIRQEKEQGNEHVELTQRHYSVVSSTLLYCTVPCCTTLVSLTICISTSPHPSLFRACFYYYLSTYCVS